jgi:hypothetical protein
MSVNGDSHIWNIVAPDFDQVRVQNFEAMRVWKRQGDFFWLRLHSVIIRLAIFVQSQVLNSGARTWRLCVLA